ncbi:hypothetical protein ACFL17_05810 [Pseudomonadota bacterium]
MSYSSVLDTLTHFNLYAWLIAAVGSFLVQRYIRSKGWTIIMIGSCFVVLRQLWAFLPGYGDAKSAEYIINAYMNKFLMGTIGAVLILVGTSMLIVNYYVVQKDIGVAQND